MLQSKGERIKLQSLYSTLLDSGASVSLKVTLESLVTHINGNISLLDYISAPVKNVNKTVLVCCSVYSVATKVTVVHYS